MFPSRGCCHGVFLLGHAAKQKRRHSVDEWVRAARERSTYMSMALQLNEIANGLLRLDLATIQGEVRLGDALSGLCERADRPTFLAIARLLLQASPPSWLRFVVRDGRVTREYVPTGDFENLDWIEPELDQFLLDAYGAASAQDESFLRAMGDVAELFVLAALEHAGASPLHVSRLSDSYGYDIECPGNTVDRIEVKAASEASQSRFHISRNEFEKSSRYGSEWRLLQVVFSSKAFVSDRLDSSHIENLRELRPGVLQELVPTDTDAFKWTVSAEIFTTPEVWGAPSLVLDPSFSTAGFLRRALKRSDRGRPTQR